MNNLYTFYSIIGTKTDDLNFVVNKIFICSDLQKAKKYMINNKIEYDIIITSEKMAEFIDFIINPINVEIIFINE